jgi:hypothetical protein
MRRALAIAERSGGPEVASHLGNLAALLVSTNRYAEAEPLYRRVLAIRESVSPEHPSTAVVLNGLARLLQATDRPAEAESLMRRSLAIGEKSLGPHPSVALYLNNLARLRAERDDWAEAAKLHLRAKPIMIGARRDVAEGVAKAVLTDNTWSLRAAARAVHRAGGAASRAEAFELAQWALQTGVADALVQVAVRFAKGVGSLAEIVRERQDLVARRQGEDKRLLGAVGRADATGAEVSRAAMASLSARLDAIDKQLAAEFPEYASLASPKPLPIVAVQGLLREDEALVLFLDVPRLGRLPEETLAWAVTRAEVRWISVPLGSAALAEGVGRLRCGLDREGEWAWSDTRRRWEARNRRRSAAFRLCDGARALRGSAGTVRRPHQGQDAPHRAVGGADELAVSCADRFGPTGSQTGLAGADAAHCGATLGGKPAGPAQAAAVPGAGALHRLRQSAARRRSSGRRPSSVGQRGTRHSVLPA